ncbi:MAG: transglycosylase SLT domain-containing protein [Bdellovibrionota bacterium]
MILKYTIFAILTLFFITASDPYFGFELGQRVSPAKSEDDVIELPFYSQKALEPYLRDHANKVNPVFKIGEFYYANVRFWFLIYTKLESTQVAIHDRSNLSIIYKVLDFSELKKKGLHSNTLYVLQQKLSRERIDEIRLALDLLVKDPHNMNPESREIFRAVRNGGTDLPSDRKERSALFQKLRENIRVQTGQKDFIEAGLRRSLPYQKFLRTYFEQHELPAELAVIPFLESSFNPRAHSKVSALGVWQFMPLIGSYYLPKRTTNIDYRSNVGLSSIAAANLLKENHRIMKKWDLTVTSYNSGTKHLLKSRRELASLQDIDLEDIIRHSSSTSFGFASKNFYAEFLALAHVMAYEDDLFPGIHQSEREDAEANLVFAVAKCPMRIDKEVNALQLDEIAFYNDHIRDFKKIYSKGTIITTKARLPASKFYTLDARTVLKKKPKDWVLLVRNQSCSTR